VVCAGVVGADRSGAVLWVLPAGWVGSGAFEPSMMVALLVYAYARGERSSRGIERRCVEDVAFRVIAAQQKPDHATIARFRVRHEEQLAISSAMCSCSAGRRAW
jgi:transposase